MCAGNAATFYFLPIVLLASVVGLASTLVGFHHLRVWRTDSLAAAAAASLIAWLITLLAFGYVPVIFWRPCFFICPWRWSSLMFSLQSLERQTGVDTGHLIPRSLRRSFCSAYSNKAWTFLKAWWRKIFCKLNKQCRFMMVNGEIICRLACKEIHIGGHRSRKLVREAHNFLNSWICFLYVWDNFRFMGVMGSTTRSCLGSWWRLRLEDFCCWLENVKQKVVEAFTVILAVFELLYLMALHAGILGGEYGPSYTNNNNTNATATGPAAGNNIAVSEKHLHGTAAAAAVWSSSSYRASQLQINPWYGSSSSSSFSISILPTNSAAAFINNSGIQSNSPWNRPRNRNFLTSRKSWGRSPFNYFQWSSA